MKKNDTIFAFLVVVIWGANFTVIKLGLDGVPSMLLVVLRYAITSIAVFFVKKPNINWKYIILYGLSVGVGQFSCLFYAMEIGMPASLASILLQLQAFISPFLALLFLKQKIKSKQLIGFFIGAVGLFIIGIGSGTTGVSAIPINALLLTICAPFFWALANIIAIFASQKASSVEETLDMLGLVVWSSLVPPIPMLGIALIVDTPQALLSAVMNLNAMSIFSILYLSLGATLFGYGMWNMLIAKYTISKIAPLSLLVPITGLLTARIVLSEQLSRMQWIGVVIILTGLILTSLNLDMVKSYFNMKKIKNEIK
ncbi:O-acetylserine/cysteine efflux transporter [Sedimentibacter acidaminivorans]|uniref:O-acetylserine/cysteine efflux transporter n=1 Tax=Sedimentibacter acidaminivorans TaxID=913099 RepID=A0ABS4GBF6_9FIRM|nr:EamA family transporter [Sedimentibacter acidaminivorans]MBP1924735.1 O-acetylserine/cysteine efflux transporter [Sedimentibacter acidaminivorans]